MKICIVATGYPSQGRAQNIFVEQLVNKFLKRGVDLTVIAPQSVTHALFHKIPLRGRCNQHVSPDGITYKVFRPYCLTIGDNYPKITQLLDIFAKRSIKKILKKERPDVLYAHFWGAALYVDYYARKKDIPLFVACGEGDNAIEYMIEHHSSDFVKQLRETVNGVISVSTENKRECIKHGLCSEENVIILPNCVDTGEFMYNPSLSKREELGCDENDFVIAFCGAFIHRKGSKRVSEAIKKLNDPNIKSIFIGKPFDGEDETPDCPGIVYMGGVEHQDLPKYLNSANLFVLPTLKEGCCNAIVEALACGLPVVSSDGPFNDDILNDNNSIRVDANNVDEIAQAIYQIKNDKDRRMQMRNYLISNSADLSLDNRAKKILQFIERLK